MNESPVDSATSGKHVYSTPQLTLYGALAALTATGSGSQSESAGDPTMNCLPGFMSHMSCVP